MLSKKLNRIGNIVFDFDGTLHNTYHIYYEALLKCVKDNNIISLDLNNKEFIKSLLGDKPQDAWKKIVPNIKEDKIQLYIEEVSKNMSFFLKNGKGSLYFKTKETLINLKNKGYKLYLLTYSKQDYIKISIDVYGLENIFEGIYTSDTKNFIDKKHTLRKLKKNLTKDIVMIGDRYHDIYAGASNDIFTIFCSYGYGKIKESYGADMIIDNIERINEIF